MSQAPIITDFCYSEEEDLLVLSLSNKLLLFYRLIPPVFAGSDKTSYGILPQILHLFEPEYPVSNVFYLLQSKVFFCKTTEAKILFIKALQKMDSFQVVIISSFVNTDDVQTCLELEKSRYLATGGIGGKIKIWDMTRKTPKYVLSLKDYGKVKNAAGEKSEFEPKTKIETGKKKGDRSAEKGIIKMIYSRAGPGLLLSIGFESNISVWSPDTSLSKAYIGRLEGHSSIVRDIVFIKDTF
jgi:WD40 repeat protein